MIFEGRLLKDITNEEIKTLVRDHASENQQLEFKLTIDHKSDDDKFETLRDITSLANIGGGYLIIGIRDDGKGRAQKFESVAEPERIVQSVQGLCLDYISERIDGIEWDTRLIDNNLVIIIRVPESLRTPHMVSYKNRTHFSTRYNDGKREMTIGEIRAAFTDNLFGRRLALIEDGLKTLVKNNWDIEKEKIINSIEYNDLSLLNVTEGEVIAEATMKLRMKEIDQLPYFRISITPEIVNRNFLDVDALEIRNLITNPPEQRSSGWNMKGTYSNLQRFSEGLIRTFDKKQSLILLQNGHMEFNTLIDDSFCWNQAPEEFKKSPRLYPYPVIEYPLSFLKLYKVILEKVNYRYNLIISMQYFNVKNHVLLPYTPNSFGFRIRSMELKPFEKQNIYVPDVRVQSDYSPDLVTFELVKYLYASFGYTSDKIPFFVENLKEFNIEH